jgi:hypothetical protein
MASSRYLLALLLSCSSSTQGSGLEDVPGQRADSGTAPLALEEQDQVLSLIAADRRQFEAVEPGVFAARIGGSARRRAVHHRAARDRGRRHHRAGDRGLWGPRDRRLRAGRRGLRARSRDHRHRLRAPDRAGPRPAHRVVGEPGRRPGARLDPLRSAERRAGRHHRAPHRGAAAVGGRRWAGRQPGREHRRPMALRRAARLGCDGRPGACVDGGRGRRPRRARGHHSCPVACDGRSAADDRGQDHRLGRRGGPTTSAPASRARAT